ncbi:tyrosine-protein phosphatase [Paludisphaera mucosa]|uniref:Tyrosine-protein phosphatase n=1 Tax=Paludisphaera mucosa TaxID=3030827 RepID=A0ABT6F945_9BACT|nr:tyrosine-protein phosphatase [Paludisphaera mucosa]MDG3004110.1 tyrosine-protein phosphatase [Paludisphaera mucosa]
MLRPATVVPDAAPARVDVRPEPPRRVSRLFRRSAQYFGLAALLFFGSLALRPYVSQNLGVIAPGRALRSAQPTSGLKGLIDEHRLASILNLRGGEPGDDWYAHEVRTTAGAGVDFFDLPLSAVRRPSRRELLLLIDVLVAARPPLLIHCRAGADRTGLATVVYNLMVLGRPPEEAMAAFTVFHGHFPIFGTQHLHEPIDEYAAWLKERGLSHAPDRFRRWAREEYRAPDPPGDPRPLPAGPRRPK